MKVLFGGLSLSRKVLNRFINKKEYENNIKKPI